MEVLPSLPFKKVIKVPGSSVNIRKWNERIYNIRHTATRGRNERNKLSSMTLELIVPYPLGERCGIVRLRSSHTGPVVPAARRPSSELILRFLISPK
jgi:hypothetical protein